MATLAGGGSAGGSGGSGPGLLLEGHHPWRRAGGDAAERRIDPAAECSALWSPT